MSNLFLSFSIAIGAAVGLVTLSKIFDLDFYTYKMLPLVPILYAIVYEVIEHTQGGKGKTKAAPPANDKGTARAVGNAPVVQGLTVERIIMGIGVSFAIKFAVELCLVLLFLKYSGQSFNEAYGSFGFGTVGAFLRGEHTWVSGNQGVYMLALIALATCFGTGLWIGYTSKGNAVLEGVIIGAAVTVLLSMTNMLDLYRKFEEVTIRLADSMGYVMHTGFVVVVGLQVLLYGLWSGLVQMGKEDRAQQKAVRKSKK
jgi:hypothetical protein